jgi:uncharacterized membrane protein YkvA (DUF1232 family)
MAVFLRLLAFAAVWGASRLRRATAPLIAREIDGLSWPKKVRLVWALSRDKRVPIWTRLIVVAPAIYLASPIDLLPDFIPVVGRLDDAAVFSLSIDLLTRTAPAPVLAEHLARLKAR